PPLVLYCCRRSRGDTPTTWPSALSLHDALPILAKSTARLKRLSPLAVLNDRFSRANCGLAASIFCRSAWTLACSWAVMSSDGRGDRKSTRLNSSHVKISYAVFCSKKKITKEQRT